MAIFISYSRKDAAFVRRLHEALAAQQRETWVDWEGIAPSADWFREIEAAIDAADAFAFLLSPDSLASAVCVRELAHAVAQNKRILPLVRRDAGDGPVPAALAKLNWIFLRDGDDFDTALGVLLAAVDTDLDWVQAHTRLLVRAREWEGKSLDASLTLRGADLKAAEAWLALGPTKAPPPTAPQTRFVIESRRQATKRRFQLLGGMVVALIVMAVLGTLSVFERRQAARQEAIAVARRLAASAERLRDQMPAVRVTTSPLERNLQLAAEAIRRLDVIGERSLDADLALRRALARLPQHLATLPSYSVSGKFVALAFTADGGLVAASKGPLASTSWNLRSRERAAEPPFVGDRMHLALAPDGQWLAVARDPGHGERALEVRDARTLEATAQFTGLGNIIDLAAGPGGLLAASLSADPAPGETRVWRLPARESFARLPFAFTPAFSADGRYLAGIVDDKVVVWSIERLRAGDKAVAATLDVPGPRGLQFSTDGSRLVVRSGDEPEQVGVWAVAGWTKERDLPRDGFVTAGPAARRWLVRDGASRALLVIDSLTDREVARIFTGTPDAAAAWSPDGQWVAVENGNAVDLWRPVLHGSASAGVDVGVGAGAVALAIAFGADEARITVLARRGAANAQRVLASTWDLSSLKRIGEEVDLGEAPTVAAFSADGRRVALGSAGRARVVDPFSGRLVSDTPVPGSAAAVALAANGKFFAVLSSSGMLSAWQLDPPRLLAAAEQAASAVGNLLAISADGTTVTAINFDGNKRIGAAQSVRQWRVDAMAQAQAAGRPVGQMTSGFAASVCALSAGGETMAVYTSDAALHLRDTRTGRDLAVVDEAGGSGAICAFSADHRYLATTGADASLRVWDIAAREEVARMELPATAHAIAFSPGSRHVAVLGADGVLRRWPLGYADLLAQACARLASNMARSDWQRFTPAEPYRPTCGKLPAAPEERR